MSNPNSIFCFMILDKKYHDIDSILFFHPNHRFERKLLYPFQLKVVQTHIHHTYLMVLKYK